MTITITLRDEVENLLREKAAQRGVTLDSLAAEILDRVLSEENLEAACCEADPFGIAKIQLSLQTITVAIFETLRILRRLKQKNMVWCWINVMSDRNFECGGS
jgi:hypothetical protein